MRVRILAGNQNSASGTDATVEGGSGNSASGAESVVSGGAGNVAGGAKSAVAGGVGNAASGEGAFVAGGYHSAASGLNSFAGGTSARATKDGEFVWADESSLNGFDPSTATRGWGSAAANTFNVRAVGGAWIVTGIDGTSQPTTSVYVNSGSGTWSSTSDRASKENFRAVDGREVLARVAAMPVQSWNYIAEGAHVRHIGPVAQDFHAAFAVGPNDTSITSIDEGGVALAAIKGLNEAVRPRTDSAPSHPCRQSGERCG